MTLVESAPTARRDAAAVDACPISPLVDIVFSRWTTPILWVLQHHGPTRFNEIRRRLGSVTAKVLTQRLRHLERDGLVRRTYIPAVPPQAEYAITDLGLSLSPTFRALATWVDGHMPAVVQARADYDSSGRPRPA